MFIGWLTPASKKKQATQKVKYNSHNESQSYLYDESERQDKIEAIRARTKGKANQLAFGLLFSRE